MTSVDRTRKIKSLEELRDQADALADEGPENPEFLHWHSAAIEALVQGCGSDSELVREFTELQFQLPPRMKKALRETLRKIRLISEVDNNVTRIETAEQALKRSAKEMLDEGVPIRKSNSQFKRALSEAKVILLEAILELRAASN